MSKIIGLGFGADLCRAIGIDPHGVRELDIHVHPKELVTITTKNVLFDKQAASLTEFFRQYEVVERKHNIISDFDGWFNAACAKAGVA